MKAIMVVFAIFLSACAKKQIVTNCQEADWYELGRRSGAMGLPFEFENKDLPVLCPHSNNGEQKRVYISGRNAGLVEFCRPDNAFELGKQGKTYNNVCPTEFHFEFLQNFRRGHRVRELQEANQNIDKKISILDEKLRQLQQVQNTDLQRQRLELKKIRDKNSLAIKKFDSQLSQIN